MTRFARSTRAPWAASFLLTGAVVAGCAQPANVATDPEEAAPAPAAAVEPQRPASASPQPAAATAGTQELEVVFWQSIVNSTNPAEFEAYLEQFPNGVFRTLAEARLAALRGSAGSPSADARSRTPYELSATMHRAPGGCGDFFDLGEGFYTRVRVIDPELEGRIDAVERRTGQLLGDSNMSRAQDALDGFSQRELRSDVEPLSEAERRSLERLRAAKRAHDNDVFRAGFFPDRDELEALEARVPLSAAESVMLRQGQELVDRWSRLVSERRVATNPRSMRVYENERLIVAIYEEDFFADDRCFTTDVTLDRAILDRGSLELGRGLMTLRFTAVP